MLCVGLFMHVVPLTVYLTRNRQMRIVGAVFGKTQTEGSEAVALVALPETVGDTLLPETYG